ncbi:ribF [Wigglesworthia glossinidia endosymbiont of Glossina brevipalpis]|uniref:Riboflavin biosynthesis protein n=1 Tax=Wigglesworthia glossinidia brevipalpis TaxID=36870 RepID=Q8D2Q9_WIGBR|nr:ribF [Wigglesworthia glossinidia endosymbiont of Glossina brevipalpis]
MKFKHIRNIFNLKKQYINGCVITIGNFDGVHLGHQKIISKLKNESLKRNLPMIVVIFEPQPKEFINKNSPSRITGLRDKIKYFKKMGIKQVLCINFNKNFLMLNAKDFIKNFLIKSLNMKCIIIGKDFRFGYKAYGDVKLLKNSGKKLGFNVLEVKTLEIDSEKISSTAIRNALKNNKLEKAIKFLGHEYSISGRVVCGKAIGRLIGFPTINISSKNIKFPINGVYAVEVNGITKKIIYGIANIGTRPTFFGLNQKVEVHLLNKSGNFYSCHIEIIIRKKIREERFFRSTFDLKNQILYDINKVNDYFVYLKNKRKFFDE